jgi:kinesin family protein 2/24
MVKDANASDADADAAVEAIDVEFCPGISVRSAEPGVMVAQVPGMKVRREFPASCAVRLTRPQQWSGPNITPKSYEADLAFGPDVSNDEVYARTVDAHDVSRRLVTIIIASS